MSRAKRYSRDDTANDAISKATKADPTGAEHRRKWRSRVAAIEERNRRLREARGDG